MRVCSVLLALLVIFVFLVDCAPHVRVRVQDLLRQRLINAEQIKRLFSCNIDKPCCGSGSGGSVINWPSGSEFGSFQLFKKFHEKIQYFIIFNDLLPI